MIIKRIIFIIRIICIKNIFHKLKRKTITKLKRSILELYKYKLKKQLLLFFIN
jgi:hypothetical protein